MQLNLRETCGGLLDGVAVARAEFNLQVTVETVLSFSRGRVWALRVEKPRWSGNGRRLKSETVLILVAKEGETPADLIRQLAEVWDQGEVSVQ